LLRVSGTKLPQFLSSSVLKPFIFNHKDAAHFETIICYKGGRRYCWQADVGLLAHYIILCHWH
jgi:hypothetical protein